MEAESSAWGRDALASDLAKREKSLALRQHQDCWISYLRPEYPVSVLSGDFVAFQESSNGALFAYISPVLVECHLFLMPPLDKSNDIRFIEFFWCDASLQYFLLMSLCFFLRH